MSLLKPNKISYNSEAIADMYKKISETAAELKSLNAQIKKDVDEMNKNWQTTEGRKFLQDINMDWSKQVDQYVVVLETIQSMLGDTSSIYDTLTEKVKLIKYGD